MCPPGTRRRANAACPVRDTEGMQPVFARRDRGAVKTGAATVDHRCVKSEDHAVGASHSVDPARWQEAFEVLMSRMAGRFARVEPRRRVRDLVLGLLSDLSRKNCWSIAKWAGQASPHGM
ncbi:transposase [Streptomyces viridochromogenes DSM 40736]|uniref:Transposase n=1 Tax=Streptomyces viridochromogenes (strain DSM 40736 / JCM 4977 / BCRC 1201 / Tue 494) TaxID=591159 RepID=D9X347_STRVT|nr:transposase [Streptomyces viridochromogenes DSM 40736]